MAGDPVRDPLTVLAAATDAVALGPYGDAAIVTDACRAFRELHEAPDVIELFEPELVGMVRDGAPAAILYAALLLQRIGRDVAPLLAPYADDRRACTIAPGGCEVLSLWLCEAARWVLGGGGPHPAHLLELRLEAIARATWFELPGPDLLRPPPPCALGYFPADAARAFAELLASPAELVAARPRIERWLGNPHPAVRLYAALLLRAVDRPAGECALAALAAAGGHVERMQRAAGTQPSRSRVPIAGLVAELADWPPA